MTTDNKMSYTCTHGNCSDDSLRPFLVLRNNGRITQWGEQNPGDHVRVFFYNLLQFFWKYFLLLSIMQGFCQTQTVCSFQLRRFERIHKTLYAQMLISLWVFLVSYSYLCLINFLDSYSALRKTEVSVLWLLEEYVLRLCTHSVTESCSSHI